MCGARVEDWVHVIVECPMYSDIKNLGFVGISWADGLLDISGVISTVEMLNIYDRLFCFRVNCLNGGDG